MKSALTIAASDPSGGAGIQADLKAFSYMGVHGCSVITAVTAQNTKRVYQINAVPQMAIAGQLEAVLEDIKIAACKTGMLYSPNIVELVATRAEDFDCPLVVDPVMKATVGEDLHESGFVEALKKSLFPKATLVTPNIPEAETLTGLEIKTIDDMKEAAGKIHKLGCKYVLLKGGHLKEMMATDILFSGNEFRLYISSLHPKELHGTGCTFSALITALLAVGKSMEDAVSEAKFHMDNVIAHGYDIGEGYGVTNLIPEPSFSREELRIIEDLKEALSRLHDTLPVYFVPEVGINIGFALEKAETLDDVCALEGRLVRVGDRMGHLGGFKFGASKHIARIILTAMKFDSEIRSAMNIRYDESTIEACSNIGLTLGSFERKDEPKIASTMEWGCEMAIKELGKVPDIIYDKGGIGKEPMIRILGKNPAEVVDKLKAIIKGDIAEN